MRGRYWACRSTPALRRPGASAVIYGGLEEKGIAFEGVADALQVPESDLRLFGKPESFVKRRMGVAVANADTTDEARRRAKLAASRREAGQGPEPRQRRTTLVTPLPRGGGPRSASPRALSAGTSATAATTCPGRTPPTPTASGCRKSCCSRRRWRR
jgi:hypothetical protein